MAPNSTESKSKRIQRTLRKVAIGSAACGLFLNIFSTIVAASQARSKHRPMVAVDAVAFLPLLLSFIWNIVEIVLWKKELHHVIVMIVDLGFFFVFLAFSIANGVVINGLDGGWNYAGSDKTMMYTYNSVPWIVCATMHLCIALLIIVRALPIGKEQSSDVTCPDCHRKWHRGDSGSKDEATESLLAAHEYDDDADGA